MRRREFAGFVVAGGLALLLTACSFASEAFRYRLTVEVETPKGMRTGSGVIEVDLTQSGDSGFILPDARGENARLRGEAVAVELPGGRVLFALLRSRDQADAGKWYAHRAIRTPSFSGEYAGIERTRYMKARGLSGELTGDQRPMLVTFGDLNDPTSVELVDPDDLAASFGEGYALKRITVQMTDDPVTTGIDERLGWLGQIKGMGLKRSDFPEDVPVGAFSEMFRKEF